MSIAVMAVLVVMAVTGPPNSCHASHDNHQYICHRHHSCHGLVGHFTEVDLSHVQWTEAMSLWRRGERTGNALRTLGGALGRRNAMTMSSLESCILCVISNV